MVNGGRFLGVKHRDRKMHDVFIGVKNRLRKKVIVRVVRSLRSRFALRLASYPALKLLWTGPFATPGTAVPISVTFINHGGAQSQSSIW